MSSIRDYRPEDLNPERATQKLANLLVTKLTPVADYPGWVSFEVDNIPPKVMQELGAKANLTVGKKGQVPNYLEIENILTATIGQRIFSLRVALEDNADLVNARAREGEKQEAARKKEQPVNNPLVLDGEHLYASTHYLAIHEGKLDALLKERDDAAKAAAGKLTSAGKAGGALRPPENGRAPG